MSRVLRGFPFEVENTSDALDDLEKLDTKNLLWVQNAIRTLALTGVGNVLMLKPPFDDAWRLRVGNYRVKFELELSMITIITIEKREDAYRKRSRKS